jgi:uncharacterized protein YggE
MLAIFMMFGSPHAKAETPGITVSGSGTVKSKPTEIEIGAMISGEAELTNDALVKYRDAKKRAIAAVDGLKMKEVSVESNGVSINQAYDPNAQQMMMQGRATNIGKPKVQASESLKIVMKGVDKLQTDALLDTVMKVIDTGRDAGLQIGPPTPMNYYQMQQMMQQGQGMTMLQFKISDPAKQREEAYKQAMDDAKAKAKRLAELAGVKLGRIVAVQDGPAIRTDNQMAQYMYNNGMAQPSDPSEMVSQMLTDISLKVTLTVQFEIEK